MGIRVTHVRTRTIQSFGPPRREAAATRDGRSLAPEPASSYLMGLKDAATDNRVLSLDPGERHATFVNLSVKAWPDPGRPVSRAATE